MANVPLIAIIDDDEGVRRSLDGLVRSLGYRAATFGSAEDFLGSAQARESQCVISDIHMPGMDGIALTRSLVGSDKTNVILISAFLDEDISIQARDAGAFCFLRKPFSGDALIGCIERALAA
jgi:FixJ family two-component response regulator